MIRNKLITYTGSAIATVVATPALAAPATAMQAKVPDLSKRGDPIVTTDGDTPWLEIGLGALGGLAIAGAGHAPPRRPGPGRRRAAAGDRQGRSPAAQPAESLASALSTTARSVVGHIGGREARRNDP